MENKWHLNSAYLSPFFHLLLLFHKPDTEEFLSSFKPIQVFAKFDWFKYGYKLSTNLWDSESLISASFEPSLMQIEDASL